MAGLAPAIPVSGFFVMAGLVPAIHATPPNQNGAHSR
jgi:hypothetical protein